MDIYLTESNKRYSKSTHAQISSGQKTIKMIEITERIRYEIQHKIYKILDALGKEYFFFKITQGNISRIRSPLYYNTFDT